MSLDDFEELLADAPEDGRWELIGGRVVRMMVGARWEHNRIINNLSEGLNNRLRARGSSCRTLTETFRVRDGVSPSSLLPDIHYVLVTRDSPHVETIDRLNGEWSAFRIADGLAATLALPGLGIDVLLAEVYADLFE